MTRPAALAPALLAAVLAACASTGPTTVPAPHVAKVARDVQQWHDVKHPDCPYAEVVATRVLGRDGARARELCTTRYGWFDSVSSRPGNTMRSPPRSPSSR